MSARRLRKVLGEIVIISFAILSYVVRRGPSYIDEMGTAAVYLESPISSSKSYTRKNIVLLIIYSFAEHLLDRYATNS
jgi:hypothetical protein